MSREVVRAWTAFPKEQGTFIPDVWPRWVTLSPLLEREEFCSPLFPVGCAWEVFSKHGLFFSFVTWQDAEIPLTFHAQDKRVGKAFCIPWALPSPPAGKCFCSGDCDDLIMVIFQSWELIFWLTWETCYPLEACLLPAGKGWGWEEEQYWYCQAMFIAGWNQWKVPGFAEGLCLGACTPLDVCRMF